MRIGELAERAGTTPRTLRYYESLGLLTAHRLDNGYRWYGEEEIALVRWIKLLQEYGFGLEDTRPFVECLRSGHESADVCPGSQAAYRRRLADLDGYIARLLAVRDRIAAQLAAVGDGAEPPTDEVVERPTPQRTGTAAGSAAPLCELTGHQDLP